MGLLKEFKEFALKGSVVDLAVGVVIGVAFNTVVNSLVQDVMMPPLGLLTGGVDFKDKKITLKHAVLGPDGQVMHPAVNITYGVFINDVINFVIVALAIFIVIKLMNSAKRQPPPAPAVPPPPTKEEVLLAEIRDAIRAK